MTLRDEALCEMNLTPSRRASHSSSLAAPPLGMRSGGAPKGQYKDIQPLRAPLPGAPPDSARTHTARANFVLGEAARNSTRPGGPVRAPPSRQPANQPAPGRASLAGRAGGTWCRGVLGCSEQHQHGEEARSELELREAMRMQGEEQQALIA